MCIRRHPTGGPEQGGIRGVAISNFIAAIRNNPDYFGAVSTGYAVVSVQVAVQLLLIPLYLHTIGIAQFGILMVLISATGLAFQGISWSYGSVLRILGSAAVDPRGRSFENAYAALKWIFFGYGLIVALAGGALFWLYFSGLSVAERGGLDSRDLIYVLFAAGFNFLILVEFAVDQMAFSSLKRQTLSNGLLLLSLGVFAVAVFAAIWSGLGMAGIFASLALGTLVARVAAQIQWARGPWRVHWRLPGPTFGRVVQRFVAFSRRGYLLYGLIFIALQADILIVGLLGGPRLAAEYVLVWKIAEMLVLLVARVSEGLQPEIVATDVRGDSERLSRIYFRGVWLARGLSIAAGVLYALLGPWAVSLWVGEAALPESRLAFALAGGAIAFLGSARFPAIFAYSLVQLRRLLLVSGSELGLKLVLIVLLFPSLGILAPLIAINALHGLGFAFAYARLPRLTAVAREPGPDDDHMRHD